MSENRIRSILIVGSDLSAWLAAAVLVRRLDPSFCSVRVVAGPTPAAPRVVATLPSFHRLVRLLGLNEDLLMRRACGTFSLGTTFIGWPRHAARYFHGFGSVGARLDAVPFHQHWLRLRSAGVTVPLEEYSIAAVAARQGRFAVPSADPRSPLSRLAYGQHFDAGLAADVFRDFAVQHGATVLGGRIAGPARRKADGRIDALPLTDGSELSADLYIDCLGVGSVLEQADAHRSRVDWGRWLPCDRGIALSFAGGAPPPYSTARAAASGWMWEIPLRDRVEIGYAFSSAECDAAAAETFLRGWYPEASGSAAEALQFAPGRPSEFWEGNCVHLVPGGLDPLESMSVHLAQTAITRFLSLFPVGNPSAPDLAEYNRLTTEEYDRIRDLLVLHFHANNRPDFPFWNRFREMELPDTLKSRLELFTSTGRLPHFDGEHFSDDSWVSVLIGQYVLPQAYDPLADVAALERPRDALRSLRAAIAAAVSQMRLHADLFPTAP